MTLDNLRKIVYDPTWNPAEEERLLTALDTAIGQVVRNILGVDIGFVQDGLRAFYLTSKQAHDWRMRLKAEADRIELEMLERQDDERQSLWWVNEIVLGILFEPLDWLFTARDLLQGDLTALIGFLPLIPGSLRHIFDAATGLKIDDIAREVDGRLDEFGEAWRAGNYKYFVPATGLRTPQDFRLDPTGDEYYALGYPLYSNITDRSINEMVSNIQARYPEIPEQVIRTVYKHVFDEKHTIINDLGEFTGYFSPDPMIGFLWLRAIGSEDIARKFMDDVATGTSARGLDQYIVNETHKDILSLGDSNFNQLLAHEYIEARLMELGYKYNLTTNVPISESAHYLSVAQFPSPRHPYSHFTAFGMDIKQVEQTFSQWMIPVMDISGNKTWRFNFQNLDELIQTILEKVTG